MRDNTFNRQQLYELVWSTPLLRLSKTLCISDNGLRKMCKTMNIPLPPNGYWQKIKYRKPVKKPKLPKENSGRPEVVLKPRTPNCSDTSSKMSAQSALVNEIKDDKKLRLEVPERLSSRPDPLITSTRVYRDAIKRHDWRRGGQYPDEKDVLNISVSDDGLPRAYRLMDTIIKLLKSRNHEVRVSYDRTVAVIEGEEIEFRLQEKQQVVKQGEGYGSREMSHTGDFVFIFGDWHRKVVNEGKKKLESKIAVILAKLELEGKHKKEERIRWEIRRREQEEKDRIAREIRERKEAELKKFTDIFKEAIQLHHTTILRNYIDVIENNLENRITTSDVGEEWIRWANQKIDWYDPIINQDDLLLDDSHKATAFSEFLSIWK
jgi:hypothetical protein